VTEPCLILPMNETGDFRSLWGQDLLTAFGPEFLLQFQPRRLTHAFGSLAQKLRMGTIQYGAFTSRADDQTRVTVIAGVAFEDPTGLDIWTQAEHVLYRCYDEAKRRGFSTVALPLWHGLRIGSVHSTDTGATLMMVRIAHQFPDIETHIYLWRDGQEEIVRSVLEGYEKQYPPSVEATDVSPDTVEEEAAVPEEEAVDDTEEASQEEEETQQEDGESPVEAATEESPKKKRGRPRKET